MNKIFVVEMENPNRISPTINNYQLAWIDYILKLKIKFLVRIYFAKQAVVKESISLTDLSA